MRLELRVHEPGDAPPEFFDLYGRSYRQKDEGLGAARAYLAVGQGRVLARLSAQLGPGLQTLQGPLGLIGHYETLEPEAGRTLLGRACRDLKSLGAKTALGPLNGSTWCRYRLALPPENDSERGPFFLGEPENPASYSSDFEAVGFSAKERYESRQVDLSEGLPWDTYLPERVRIRMARHVRPLDLKNYEADLRGLYGESLESFDSNTLFSPLSEAEFLAAFLPLKDFYDPEFVRLYCSDKGRVEGHVTAYPDGERLILKTLSCRAEVRGLGVAHLLSFQVHELAFRRGFKSVVHALMHVDNRSNRMSETLGRVIRRYALYGKEL